MKLFYAIIFSSFFILNLQAVSYDKIYVATSESQSLAEAIATVYGRVTCLDSKKVIFLLENEVNYDQGTGQKQVLSKPDICSTIKRATTNSVLYQCTIPYSCK